MSNSKVLDLVDVEWGRNCATAYPERVETETIENGNKDKLDAFAGKLTSSFCSVAYVSGAMTNLVGQDIYAEYTRTNRVITEVVAFAQKSGSGDLVTSIDVQLSSSSGWASIYPNAAARPNVSSSLGNYGLAKSSAHTTSAWNAGKPLRVVVMSAAGGDPDTGAQANLSVNLFWKPSASYYAG